MSASAGLGAQAAISADNQLFMIGSAKIAAEEAKVSAATNSFMNGVKLGTEINKKGGDIATGAIG